jgi:SAM-dependent methyltransferase
MNEYNAKKKWVECFKSNKISYPAEYVIRIFKGKYPNLNLDKKEYINKKICDISFGDGRHLPFLKDLGFEVYGTEIDEEIVKIVKDSLEPYNIDVDLKVGTNDNLPFNDEFFDYVLSWNEIYYMGKVKDFNIYVKELSRIMKKDGLLVLSIPKKSCFIYKNSKINNGYAEITQDPFNTRVGEILRVFSGEKEIEETFAPYFKDFIFGSINDNCFGLDYHWHLIICKKR